MGCVCHMKPHDGALHQRLCTSKGWRVPEGCTSHSTLQQLVFAPQRASAHAARTPEQAASQPLGFWMRRWQVQVCIVPVKHSKLSMHEYVSIFSAGPKQLQPLSVFKPHKRIGNTISKLPRSHAKAGCVV